jgi:hypothetical protein
MRLLPQSSESRKVFFETSREVKWFPSQSKTVNEVAPETSSLVRLPASITRIFKA